MRYAVFTFAAEGIGGRPAMYSRQEEPIAELLDFGVMYALYRRLGERLILKASWETAAGAVCSATFELDLKHSRLIALGRKGNALAPESFCAERLCAWARSELATGCCDSCRFTKGVL